MLIPIDLPPGQYRNGTILQSMGRWRDASLVRFYQGTVRPVGGWQAFSSDNTTEKPRKVHAWRTNSGGQWLAVSAANELFVYDQNGTQLDITPAALSGASGFENAALANGYGGGNYGGGAYGSDSTTASRVLPATIWSLANFGQELLACSDDDGRIFKWALDTAAPAVLVANAPTGNTGIAVTQERFVLALGAGGDTRKVQWCDREDYDTWTPLATNEAGDFVLNTVGEIKCAIPLRGQTLILTDNDAHVASFVGAPLVYEFEQAGQSCGVISKNAAEAVGNAVYWMGLGGFYAYQGGQVAELPCEVSDYVFSDISSFYRSHISAVQISEFSEIWWFYPSGSATENDRYVTLNYAQGTWQTGTLSRTAGVDRGVFLYPVMTGADLVVYNHEKSTVPAGFPVYAETGPISLGAGETTFTARRVYTDEDTQGGVKLTFKTKRHPNGPETVSPPYTPENPTGVRFTGRQIVMRVEGNEGEDWRVGVQRIEGEPRGRR